MEKIATDELTHLILKGDRRAGARLITLLEDGDERAKEIMKSLYPQTGQGMVVGITGGTGSGKSTLLDQLIQNVRKFGKKVGVVAVDPSSPFSGGAFLGDRLRMQRHTRDNGVYIRSMASRGYLGGLARTTMETIRVMEAMGIDVIFVETIGTGQDEVDVTQVAQTCLLVVTPAMGDEIQALKAGLMEIGHIFVVNKSDLEGSTQTMREVEAALSMKKYSEDTWRPRIIPTVATEGEGIDELVASIYKHQDHLQQKIEIDKVRFQRVAYELGLIFKDELERIVFKGLKGTGKKKRYIQQILDGNSDPYSVIEEVIETYLKKQQST